MDVLPYLINPVTSCTDVEIMSNHVWLRSFSQFFFRTKLDILKYSISIPFMYVIWKYILIIISNSKTLLPWQHYIHNGISKTMQNLHFMFTGQGQMVWLSPWYHNLLLSLLPLRRWNILFVHMDQIKLWDSMILRYMLLVFIMLVSILNMDIIICLFNGAFWEFRTNTYPPQLCAIFSSEISLHCLIARH